MTTMEIIYCIVVVAYAVCGVICSAILCYGEELPILTAIILITIILVLSVTQIWLVVNT